MLSGSEESEDGGTAVEEASVVDLDVIQKTLFAVVDDGSRNHMEHPRRFAGRDQIFRIDEFRRCCCSPHKMGR